MKEPLFHGVCTAMVTPFKNDEINYPMMQKLLERQIESGIHAVVIAGTTGESATLSDHEKAELFRKCKTFVGNDCLIIAGTGSNNTEHSITLSICAEEAGVDGLLVVSPYYNKATSDGIYLHYRAICDAVKLPVIIYNVPGRTGLDIPVPVYEKLSHIENVAGIKEASSDITKVAKIRNTCGEDFPIWSGNDDQIVPVMSLGGLGVISVLSNILPWETKAICDAAQNCDYKTAAQLQCRYMDLIDFLFCEVNPIPVKSMMRAIGYDCGDCRLPLCELTKENLQRMYNLIK